MRFLTTTTTVAVVLIVLGGFAIPPVHAQYWHGHDYAVYTHGCFTCTAVCTMDDPTIVWGQGCGDWYRVACRATLSSPGLTRVYTDTFCSEVPSAERCYFPDTYCEELVEHGCRYRTQDPNYKFWAWIHPDVDPNDQCKFYSGNGGPACLKRGGEKSRSLSQDNGLRNPYDDCFGDPPQPGMSLVP